jgi:glycosyltransferase involved in cell wall biosynthesis
MVREDDLFHVGMVGSMVNTRHMVRPVIEALKDVPGIRLMLFPAYLPNEQDVRDLGGWDFLSRIVSGEKWFNGFPNVYNQMDVLIRCEQDPGYSFPIPEAMACGVPVIATNSGIEEELLGSGCGIIIDGNRDIHLNHPEITTEKVREAVIRLRDNREMLKLMGDLSRQRIEIYWTWDKFINDWREFFRKGLEYAKSH